jgi:hypothetical protein
VDYPAVFVAAGLRLKKPLDMMLAAGLRQQKPLDMTATGKMFLTRSDGATVNPANPVNSAKKIAREKKF